MPTGPRSWPNLALANGIRLLSSWMGGYYNCAEQYMMAEKARLFGDEDVRSQILSEYHPMAIKKLGRKVRNYDDAVWKARRFDVVVEGNMAKFSQNSKLGDFLLETGEKILVEASPNDDV